MGISVQAPYHLCFETLANDLRMQILECIKEKPKSVQEIARKLNTERSRISHSLQMLILCNILGMRKEGKNNIYYIKDKNVLNTQENIFKALDKHLEAFCGSCKKTEVSNG